MRLHDTAPLPTPCNRISSATSARVTQNGDGIKTCTRPPRLATKVMTMTIPLGAGGVAVEWGFEARERVKAKAKTTRADAKCGGGV